MATGNQYFNPTNPGYAGNVERALNKKANAEAYEKMKGLVQMYNDNPGQFNDVEAEQIALIAKTIGLPFNREVKPIANLMYGAAEGLTLGFLPDSFRPEERGESVYGRSGANKFFSGVGMVGGGLLGLRAGTAALGLAGRGATGLGGKILSGAQPYAASAYSAAGKGAAAASSAARSGVGAASQYASGVRQGFQGTPNIGAPMFESAGANLGSMVKSGIASATPTAKAAAAQARSVWNATNIYGGQVVDRVRSGLSSYVG